MTARKKPRSANKPKAQVTAQNASRPRAEAELESRITSALAAALPTFKRDDFVQQRRFTIRLGHDTFEFDSAALWEKTGRADILIFYADRPLAVLEVKRETLALQKSDYEQAQSYANMLTPRPPLLIVSNGKHTQLFDGNTACPLDAGDYSNASITNLLENVGKIAAADMRWAIEALMGREVAIWPRAVRKCTAALIETWTDPPGAVGRPIARDLIFREKPPRKQSIRLKEANFSLL